MSGMTQALARKWRPRSFPELTGQEHVVRALANALDRGRLHHAWLFTGTRGVGKTTLARILAKALNCGQGVSSTPCGACDACLQIDAGRFVDLIELDAASNTQVDSMRELLENAMYAPTTGRYKVYIIDEVHMLSKSAFNAMLKTLEEPPEHVKFILATTDPQKIPVTVLSRCLQFNLKNIPPQLIASRLAFVLGEESVGFDIAALNLIARAAQGSLRDALSLTDQAIAHGSGRVDEASTREMLGVIDQRYLFELLAAVAQADGPGLVAGIESLAERGVGFEAALRELAGVLHRLAVIQLVPDALRDDDPDVALWRDLAARFSPQEVQLCYQIAVQGVDEIGLAPDEHAGFSMSMLRMLAFAPERESSAEARPAPARAPERPQAAPARASPVAAAAVPAAVQPPVQTPSPPPARPAGQAAAALAAARAAAEKKKLTRDDWAEFIASARVSGMARMLAQHCALGSHENDGGVDRIELVLPEAHRHLLENAYRDKLQQHLSRELGNDVQLRVRIGAPENETPVEIDRQARRRQQVEAVAAIESDPFVRTLIEQFDARLDEAAITPKSPDTPAASPAANTGRDPR
ncbi:MAG: DNA polymerase III subunit gamma/tau [Rhodocyclaceae bacterium]|jgi:DNA polymerase-3 subunit gamma/tau|nr:DNA polymerase III subunit gamma/tau [Rhodocyclaceae bacterium]MCE2978625.1 DNA polymerase III subunit gamma/tau [Betaproteobacteria bacterium]MCA3074683.1 DNA polymerase III subunit gamma/tau [Rhodocyclaceae bacterium]MCA3088844.1 DNA polymerase III subunit gamma/tau [Rhodocyclaceae bacterium]MCA3095580.1 DNA polymerase III subunit gamma/tau [Rhodocyclaceae bacterium]